MPSIPRDPMKSHAWTPPGVAEEIASAIEVVVRGTPLNILVWLEDVHEWYSFTLNFTWLDHLAWSMADCVGFGSEEHISAIDNTSR